VQLCDQILDRRIQNEVDERRLRAQDRAELVADPHLLREGTGLQPVRSLRETLAELLTGREEFTPSPPAG
jgi:UDP-glucose 4-epimerase